MLLKLLQNKAGINTQKITFKKDDFHHRTINGKNINILPINSHLQFEFSTERDGYVTILNIGTSSSVHLHVPNAYITAQKAQIFEGNYKIPGSKLLPWLQLQNNNHNYVEGGPAGWEHIAVIVSSEILIPSSIIARSTCDSPFVKLTSEDIKMMLETLSKLDDTNWSAGILSFLVE